MVSQQNYDEAYQLIKVKNQKALFLFVATLAFVLLISIFFNMQQNGELQKNMTNGCKTVVFFSCS